MITIIHGDDIASSRNFYQNERSKHKNHIVFQSLNLTISNLVQSTQGLGLFNDIKTIFIEELLTKFKKTSKETKEIIDFLNKNCLKNDFFIWESKEISKKDLFVFKKSLEKKFKLPQNIFAFLDNIRPKNCQNTISLFHKTILEGVKEELILFMLQRQFRFLLALSDKNTKDQIDEIKRIAPWQKSKLERQALYFSKDSLKKVYRKLFEIETGFKTGRLSLTLSQSIDFLLLEI